MIMMVERGQFVCNYDRKSLENEERECRISLREGGERKTHLGELPIMRFDGCGDVISGRGRGRGSGPEEAVSGRFEWLNLLKDPSRSKVDQYGGNSDAHEGERVRKLPASVTGNAGAHVGFDDNRGVVRNVSGTGLGDGRNFQVREEHQHCVQREMTRQCKQCCDQEGRNVCVANDRSRSLTPRSQSSGARTPTQTFTKESNRGFNGEHLRYPTDEFAHCGGVQPVRRDSKYQMPSAGLRSFPNEATNHPRAAECCPNVGRLGECIHPESQGSRRVYQGLKDVYPNFQGVQDHKFNSDMCVDNVMDPNSKRIISRGVRGSQFDGDTYENHVMDPSLKMAISSGVQDYKCEEHTYGNHVVDHTPKRTLSCALTEFFEKDVVQNFRHDLIEDPALDNYYVKNPAYDPELYEVIVDNKATFPGYEAKPIESHRNLHACGSVTKDMYDEEYFVDEDVPELLEPEDFEILEQPNRTYKRKHEFLGGLSRTPTFCSRDALTCENGRLCTEPETDFVPSARTFRHHGQLQMKRNVSLSKSKCRLPSSGLSEALQRRLSKPNGSSIHNRLKYPQISRNPFVGEPQRNWSYSANNVNSCPLDFDTESSPHHYEDSTKGTNLKKRLKRAAQMASLDPEISSPDNTVEKQQELSVHNIDGLKDSCHSQDAEADYPRLKVKPSDKDLPEDSEDFKRLVDEFFLKSMQHLCANAGVIKRFKEQGKAGVLKCIICSSFKAFLEPKNIAAHAFTSPKVGLRAQHLGFHRAICVLMGWDCAMTPNGRWVCRSLPDIEAWALKEDIIIWPPVVIIRNGCVESLSTNEPVDISLERVNGILTDKVCNVGRTKICRGRAGDPNIVVVEFTGTISGLQNSERVHKFFAEKKRGRNDLQLFSANFNCNGGPQVVVDEAEDNLYGYLGIMEDFDELDHAAKRFHVVKRKSEILASSADAPVQ